MQGLIGYRQAAVLSGCSKNLLPSSVTMFTQLCALDLCGWKCYTFIDSGLEASIRCYRHWNFPDLWDPTTQTSKEMHSRVNRFSLEALIWLNQTYRGFPLNELRILVICTLITLTKSHFLLWILGSRGWSQIFLQTGYSCPEAASMSSANWESHGTEKNELVLVGFSGTSWK